MRPINICELSLSDDLHELTVFGTPMFPCVACDEDFDQYTTGVLPWHWHEEIELIYVRKGAMLISCGESQYVIPEGDAVFINSNILHTGRRAQGASCCKINSILFKPEFVGGFPYSVTEQCYISPLISCQSLASVPLSQAVGWQREMIKSLCSAFCAYTSEVRGNEMLVQAEMTRFLYLLIANKGELLFGRQTVPNKNTLRVKQMLSFIHVHYSEALNVAQIAASASVSESECARCFKNVLNTTPIDYLNSYRIRVAAGLLSGTDQSVTEICIGVGFNGSSYFAKAFRKIMKCSPHEYRVAQAASHEASSKEAVK